VGSHNNQLLFLDEETTGLGEDAEICEWACIEEDGTETILWLPVDISKAEEDALKVNRYYLRCDEGYKKWGVTAADGAKIIAMKTTGKTIVGNNVGPFDTRHMRTLLKRNGLKPAWNHRVLDVVDFAAGALGLPYPWTARQVSEALGVKRNGDEHTAIGDARWNKTIYELAVKVGGREHRLQTLKSGLIAVLKVDFQGEDEAKLIETAARWAETLMPSPDQPKTAKAGA
jgi:hypothetical protein